MTKNIIVFVIIILTVLSALAMPPHPSILNKVDVKLIRSFNILPVRETDLRILKEKINGSIRLKSSKTYHGTIRGIMILVDFPDKKHIVENTFFDDLANSLDLNWAEKYPNNTNTGSVREYYRWVSNGEIDMTIDIAGWFTLPHPYTYYVNDDYGFSMAHELVNDAIDIADEYVDFSKYDNDNDGYVDMLIVVHAGTGAEVTGDKNDIWSHESAIPDKTVDNVNIRKYAMTPEYWFEKNDMTIGVYCHEMGHVFGLIDLYDIDYSSYGLGRWTLMAYGAWNGPNGPDGKPLGGSPAGLDAWSKALLGWYDVDVIKNNEYDVILEPVMESKKIIALYKNGDTTFKEYFLMENRTKDTFDKYIPSSGLLIYHIDENKSQNNEEWYPGIDPSKHYKVALVQADGRWDLEMKVNKGDYGDPYPGESNNRNFKHDTIPSSDYYTGVSYISVENIRKSGEKIVFDVKVSSNNHPPTKPYSPYPPDKSIISPKDVFLSWQCDDIDGDTLKYDVYFGKKGNMKQIRNDYTENMIEIGDIDENEEYEWKVIAKDIFNVTEGDVWTFKTSKIDNTPPSVFPIKVFEHTPVGSERTFLYRITDDTDVDVSLICSATCTYEYKDNILKITFDPTRTKVNITIIAVDTSGNETRLNETIKTFDYAVYKTPFDDDTLILVFEHGYDETPGIGFSSKSYGIYWKVFKEKTDVFEYTVYDDGALKVSDIK